MPDVKKPLVLLVLDGFGHTDRVEYNAILKAKTPVWDGIWKNQPHTLVHTSGMAVGLPDGQMGNSEVGHMTLGAGRIIYQSFTRINKAISDGDFFENPVYCEAVDAAVSKDKAVHIMGLFSPGGVHSHQDHILAAAELAAKRGAKKVYIHAFLDGRDVPPRSAEADLEAATEKLKALGTGRIASLVGRFYAMDRDSRWQRTQLAFELLTSGQAEFKAPTAVEGLKAAYERDENDEFVKPTIIAGDGEEAAVVSDGDALLFMNFRPDRARQLSRAFVDPDFDGFERPNLPNLAAFVQTTEYASNIKAPIAFPPEDLVNSFGETLAKAGKHQLRIAETEKYAHVTFFFSGGQEELYEGEDRVLVPSPDVETYDLKPEMSAFEVTDKMVEAIESGKFDAIICNYANCDMVGHTGDFDAAVKAVEAIDQCLGKVFAALDKVDGEALLTADHGNVEIMFDDANGQKHTQHTTLEVPLVYIGKRELQLHSGGSLADIAPTMLHLMGISQPGEMTGKNLVD